MCWPPVTLPENCAGRGPLTDVSTVTTGVLGNTGMESAEVVAGMVHTVRPDCVLVVDALAASSADRLGTTVQLSNAGIAPGSGVGNHRREISARVLGVPVVALGIPTVVSSRVLGGTAEEMYVTPREIDQLIRRGPSCWVCPSMCAFSGTCSPGICTRWWDNPAPACIFLYENRSRTKPKELDMKKERAAFFCNIAAAVLVTAVLVSAAPPDLCRRRGGSAGGGGVFAHLFQQQNKYRIFYYKIGANDAY